jgi:hypothetical protein
MASDASPDFCMFQISSMIVELVTSVIIKTKYRRDNAPKYTLAGASYESNNPSVFAKD